jgi:Fic family protein
MSNIDKLYAEWQSLQPLKEEDQARLSQKFMLEFNYNSNHIEGNTLTYGQTELLLLFGKVAENAKMKDLEEMKAHNVGLKMVQAEAKDKERPLTESFIRTLHKTLLREDYEFHRQLNNGDVSSYIIHAGIYKTRPNSVITQTGERFEYASPEETPALMTDLISWYNEAEKEGKITPIELASLFHYRYIRIHPFEDGNGRISRLIVNYILSRHNYPMIVIRSKDKENYLTALNRSDIVVGFTPSIGAHAELQQITPFLEYMEQCLEHALTTSIKAAKGESIEEDDDFEKQLAILQQTSMQEIDTNKNTFQNKIDIFNQFHKDFTKRLIDVLKPVMLFFNDYKVFYFISKKISNYVSVENIQLLNRDRLTLELSDKEENIMKAARSILFMIVFDNVKQEYKMEDLKIEIDANVIFNFSDYLFWNKSYLYGTYPSPSEINNIISEIKSYVLDKIRKATAEFNLNSHD